MDLSIIIVNWNSREYLRRCLTALQGGVRGLQYETIVIDSASFDGCEEMLAKDFPHVRFIQSRENVGFGKANNLAFRSAKGEFVLFLNPDTEVVDGAVQILHSALRSLPSAGAVGAKLLNPDGTVQLDCIQAFPTVLNQLLTAKSLRLKFPGLWGMAPLFKDGTEPCEVEVISGTCVMLAGIALTKVGVFSEEFFMYAEDIDLSYKIRKAGYKSYYVPMARVVHHGGGSSQVAPSNFTSVMMRESVCVFFKKTRGKYHGIIYRGCMVLSALVRLTMLVLSFPLWRLRQNRAAWLAAFRKWKAILSWSLSRERSLVV